MALTPERWIDTYCQAWREADSELVTTLFAEDGEYWWNVLEQPAVGREAIKRYWDRETGKQAKVDVIFGTPLVEDRDTLVVEFWTRMHFEGAPVTLPGCMFLRFDAEGLCQALREYWFEAPGDHAPPAAWGH